MLITGKMILSIKIFQVDRFDLSVEFDLKKIIIKTRFEPQSGILFMGNGEILDVARNMGQINEYPIEERPTKAIVDKTHFQMVDNCKLYIF